MSDIAVYKGYEIHAAPYELAEDKGWSINIHIYKHRPTETKVRNYSASNSYPSREEAVAHCLNFGRQIIDGQAENCTVEGL